MRFRKPNLLTRLISAAVAIVLVVVAAVLYNKDKPATATPVQPANPGSNAGSGNSNELSGDSLYSEINKLLRTPDSRTNINGEFTFTAYVSDEAEEVEFEDEPGVKHLYQTAWISRNDDKYFMLDVADLPAPLEPEALYTVTGTLNGSVYWTEDNKKVSVLDIIATAAKPFTRPEAKPNKGPAYTSGEMEYTFRGAHYTTILGGMRKAIVVYFNFKNGSGTDAAPALYSMSFYQDGSSERVSTTIISPKEVDSHALDANKAGASDKTYAGKTSLYYAVFEAGKDAAQGEDVIWLMAYDDDFVLTDDIGIPIMKDYAAWQENS